MSQPTAGQQALKNLMASRVAAASASNNTAVSSTTAPTASLQLMQQGGASSQAQLPLSQASSSTVSVSTVRSGVTTQMSTTITHTTTVAAIQPKPSPSLQSIQPQQQNVKIVDPKVLQQILQQQTQGKITINPSIIAMPNVSGARAGAPITINLNAASLVAAKGGGSRPQFYAYNNIGKLPANVAQQLVKSQSQMQQTIRAKPPSTTSTVISSNSPRPIAMAPVASANTASGVTPVAGPSEATALTNLIQAGLMPQGPKVASMIATTTPTKILPNPNSKPALATSTHVITNVSTADSAASAKGTNSNPTDNSAMTMATNPSSPVRPTAKQISPELLAKLTAQGVPANQQSNIAALIQANPGFFKQLGSPPKQKYASNVTVKSLLEQRAATAHKVKDGKTKSDTEKSLSSSDTEDSKEILQDSETKEELTIVSTVQASPELPQSSVPTPSKAKLAAKLSPAASTVKRPTGAGGETVAQIIQGGAVRKIQLTPQKGVDGQTLQAQPQAGSTGSLNNAIQALQLQTIQPTLGTPGQPSSLVTAPGSTLLLNQKSNVLTVQQTVSPQQLQLLQQQLIAKLGPSAPQVTLAPASQQQPVTQQEQNELQRQQIQTHQTQTMQQQIQTMQQVKTTLPSVTTPQPLHVQITPSGQLQVQPTKQVGYY